MIADWKRSGLSQRQYCREHQIVYSTFYYWLRRTKLTGGKPFAKIAKASFVKIDPVVADSSALHSELVLMDGRRLLFHQPVSAAFLKSLLS